MTLQEQEEFLRSKDWGWYLDALAFNRDALTTQERKSPHVNLIIQSKRDYYTKAVDALATRLSNSHLNPLS